MSFSKEAEIQLRPKGLHDSLACCDIIQRRRRLIKFNVPCTHLNALCTPTIFERIVLFRIQRANGLFDWDGWSLIVARPAQGDEPRPVLPASALPEGASGTSAIIRVPAGSLEPQRFGRRYAFRARSVYLAGVCMSSDEANELGGDDVMGEAVTTIPIDYLRVDSAKPPLVFRGQNRGYGEAGDIIVLYCVMPISRNTVRANSNYTFSRLKYHFQSPRNTACSMASIQRIPGNLSASIVSNSAKRRMEKSLRLSRPGNFTHPTSRTRW